jgi:hypothetical protein
MEEMKLDYKLTLDDYRIALKLHRRQETSRGIKFLVLYRAVPLLSVAGLVLMSALDVRPQATSPISFGIALLWFGVMFLMVPYYEVREGFKRLCSGGVAAPSSFVSIDDEGVRTEVPEKSETRTHWSGFVSFAENDEILLLYFSANCFLPIPVRAISPEQHKELNDFVARYLPKGKP